MVAFAGQNKKKTAEGKDMQGPQQGRVAGPTTCQLIAASVAISARSPSPPIRLIGTNSKRVRITPEVKNNRIRAGSFQILQSSSKATANSAIAEPELQPRMFRARDQIIVPIIEDGGIYQRPSSHNKAQSVLSLVMPELPSTTPHCIGYEKINTRLISGHPFFGLEFV
eukprot:5606027-Amphidinium_carterae.1